MGDDERLGVRRFRRYLQGAGRRFRQGLLRVADLPAGQGHRAEGVGHGDFLPPRGRFGLDRSYGRRPGSEIVAARRRNVGLHDAGSGDGLPPFRGERSR